MNRTFRATWIAVLAALGLLLAVSGCTTEAFCYSNCDPDGGANGSLASTGTRGNGSGVGGGLIGAGGADGGCLFGECGTGGAGTGAASASSGGCDVTSAHSCGTCDNDCFALASNWDPMTIACDPGSKPGTCSGKCAQDYVDLDPAIVGCEYYCVADASDPNDTTCDHLDQNCNGTADEGVDLCADTHNCGQCGANCVIVHGSPACSNDGNNPCAPANTHCAIAACDCNGLGDCWWDLDKSVATGCEYACDPTNGGVEICDGIDNDCDGLIDAVDDLGADSAIGVGCFGGPLGLCADIAHAGLTQCQGGVAVCVGANLLVPNQMLETCNGIDDDCDGVVDDSPSDVGASCGASNLFPCQFGTKQCMNGALVCVGEIPPGVEICNGIDDDCDGMIDLAAGMPPMDAVGACNVPPPPPAGAASPCVAGTKACAGGIVQCVGSVVAQSASDACGVDANCDGALSNQPNLMSDVNNCGACGNSCLAGAVHANWTCAGGQCAFQGCQAGYYDLNADQKCEYACVFVSAQEACNGVDDNCNGQTDENVIAPSPTQVCGVAPSAASAECTSGVSVTCVGGSWKCSFPMGVCSPTCAGVMEICDTLDNNCNGLLNENVSNYNKPCASDDGKPPPGDGACKTTGVYACNGPSATKCTAMKADCASLPGGCAELCDGVDNDCDGLVDEAYNAKGSNATYWVKPAVVRIGAAATGPWMFAYEASRPTATGLTAGSGNGYQKVAPAGVTLDKTVACSSPSVIPWSNVAGREVEQTCAAMGGRVCKFSEWKRACQVNNNDGAGPNLPDTDNACLWGYSPLGACKSVADYVGATKFCNLGGFDFDPNTAGEQDGLLPTNSPLLKQCAAVWDGYDGVASQSLYDITGNLKESTRCQEDRAVCGADTTVCTAQCCSGTSTVAGATRLCGALADTRRLSGQACAVAGDCCDVDASCTASGSCISDGTGGLFCVNAPAPVKSCRAAGVDCTLASQCCGGEPCTDGFCGGAVALVHAVYPQMGGAFTTGLDSGATCSFAFNKVSSSFKLYDAGFRCCFDANPD
jgi:hypothetical protein